MINTPENINIFIAYSQQDLRFVKELETHLSVLERLGMVDKIWYDGLVDAGSNWEATILDALHNADIILLLVSADFIASDFCYDKEMLQAVQLHEEGKVQTLPIIIRSCLWDKTPFARLKILPHKDSPIVSDNWKHIDEPYTIITKEIEQIIIRKKKELIGEDTQKQSSEYSQNIEEAEHYLAAGKWQEAHTKFELALSFSAHKGEEERRMIEERKEQCENEIRFQRDFQRGEKAYEEGRYQDAQSDLARALIFKPGDEEAQRLKTAAEVGLQGKDETEDKKKKGTKFFQIKVFGFEIFKLVIAFCFLGLVVPVMIMFDESPGLIVKNDTEGTVIYVDREGKNILKTSYQEGKDFSEELAAVKDKEDKWGYIDKEGKVVVAPKYDGAWPHSKEGLAYVRKDGKCGFIDKAGKVKIPLTYIDAAPFSEGLAMVKKGEKDFAFIDKNGKEIISGLEGVVTTAFKNGEAVVIRNKQKITIDKKGNCIEGCDRPEKPKLNDQERNRIINRLKKNIDHSIEKGEYERGLIKLKEWKKINKEPAKEIELSNKIDLLQRKINTREKAKFDKLLKDAKPYFRKGDFSTAKKIYEEALAFDVIFNKEALKNKDLCEKHLKMETNATGRLYGFLHPNGLWGIKNEKREVVIAPQYQAVGEYSNGFIAVQKEDKWGYLDKKAMMAIQPFYDKAGPFGNEGMARVMKNGKRGFIDRYGRKARPRR